MRTFWILQLLEHKGEKEEDCGYFTPCSYRVYRCTRLDFLNGSRAVCTSRVIGLKTEKQSRYVMYSKNVNTFSKNQKSFKY